jgi:hypothetical protein
MVKHLEVFGFLIGVVVCASCASQNCSNIPARPTQADDSAKDWRVPAAETPATAFVYVPSGEKQCGFGAETPIKNFLKKLEKKKIKVVSSKSQEDGLLHSQVCGAPSGKIHVFEIPKIQLKEATQLGFKPWSPPN